MPCRYQEIRSWVFNLTEQSNLFPITSRDQCEPGYLILYTIIDSGRIAFDSTQSIISDYKMFSDKTVYKIDSDSNLRFNILIQLESVEKIFNSTTSKKAFSYPGIYQVKAWLQDVGKQSNSSLWSDGFDYDPVVKYITVTDGTHKFI